MRWRYQFPEDRDKDDEAGDQELTAAADRQWLITAHKRSVGQGNVFTGVCLSTRGSAQTPECRHPSGGRPPWCRPPPLEIHGILRETVNKRAVRILLECILVCIYVYFLTNLRIAMDFWKFISIKRENSQTLWRTFFWNYKRMSQVLLHNWSSLVKIRKNLQTRTKIFKFCPL